MARGPRPAPASGAARSAAHMVRWARGLVEGRRCAAPVSGGATCGAAGRRSPRMSSRLASAGIRRGCHSAGGAAAAHHGMGAPARAGSSAAPIPTAPRDAGAAVHRRSHRRPSRRHQRFVAPWRRCAGERTHGAPGRDRGRRHRRGGRRQPRTRPPRRPCSPFALRSRPPRRATSRPACAPPSPPRHPTPTPPSRHRGSS